MATLQTTVIIRDEVFGAAIEVVVLPEPGGPGHDREFRSLSEARAYARRLADATGWALRDLCDGGATR